MDAKELGAQPAFPGFDYLSQEGKQNPPGLTLRQHFAGLAMQGMLASGDLDQIHPDAPAVVADSAVKFADALLAELAKPQDTTGAHRPGLQQELADALRDVLGHDSVHDIVPIDEYRRLLKEHESADGIPF